jgi:hypothetical protein
MSKELNKGVYRELRREEENNNMEDGRVTTNEERTRSFYPAAYSYTTT